MKKTILTSICTLAAVAAFAQGTINWSTINPTFMVGVTNATAASPFANTGTLNPSYTTSGVTTTAATSYYYELLYNTAGSQQSSPGTVAALQTWLDTGLEAENGTSGGGRFLNVSGNTEATVPWTSGSDSLVLVGWSANLGSSWATVSGLIENWTAADQATYGLTFAGVSSTGYLTPNAPSTTGATVFGSAANGNGLPMYNPSSNPLVLDELTATPEPGTLALAALGGASLLLFRRKK